MWLSPSAALHVCFEVQLRNVLISFFFHLKTTWTEINKNIKQMSENIAQMISKSPWVAYNA